MIGFLSSISDFTSSTSYNCLVTWLRHWNILLFIALCVFPLFKFFVTVCWLRSIIWYPFEPLASSFMVSAITLDFGFSTLWRCAFTAECTNVLNHFFRVYCTNRWNFLHASPSFNWNKSTRVMGVPLVRWKLDICILLSWATVFSFSAYSLSKVSQQMSSLLSTVFWKMEECLRKNVAVVRELQYHIESIQRVSQ